MSKSEWENAKNWTSWLGVAVEAIKSWLGRVPLGARKAPLGPRRIFRAGDTERAAELFADWLAALRTGGLAPGAPALTLQGYLMAPLQYWARALSGRGRMAGKAGIGLLIDVLPEIAALGLSIDDRVESRQAIWLAQEIKGLSSASYNTESQRPLLHHAIGYDGSRGLGWVAVDAMLRAGASPSSRDAFGISPLALAALHVEPELGADLWMRLVAAGADPRERLRPISSVMGGRVAIMCSALAGADGYMSALDAAGSGPVLAIVEAAALRLAVPEGISKKSGRL